MISSFILFLKTNKGYSDNTLKAYENALRDFARYAKNREADARWSTISKQLIDAYVRQMSEARVKPATIKLHVSALRTFYKTMYAMGAEVSNPARYVSTPKLGDSLPKAIPMTDIKATVHDESIDWRSRAIIGTLTETGIRLQELLELRPSDVNLSERSMRIHGKGNKERTVYYGEQTAKALESWPWRGMEQRAVRTLVYEALSKHSAAPQLSPHALRHSYATTMLNNGGRLEALSALLGHASVKTTERYARMGTPERKRQYEATMPMLEFAD